MSDFLKPTGIPWPEVSIPAKLSPITILMYIVGIFVSSFNYNCKVVVAGIDTAWIRTNGGNSKMYRGYNHNYWDKNTICIIPLKN